LLGLVHNVGELIRGFVTAARTLQLASPVWKLGFEGPEVIQNSSVVYFRVRKDRIAVTTIQDPTWHFNTRIQRAPLALIWGTAEIILSKCEARLRLSYCGLEVYPYHSQ
jgi:hypothetical protein